MRVDGLAQAGLCLGIETAGVGRIEYEANSPAERARTVKSALGSAQDLDTVEVLQAHVEKQRRIVDIGRHRRHDRGRESFLESQRLAVQTAHDQRAAVDSAEGAFI